MSRKVNSVVAKPREVQLSGSMQFAPALCVLLDPCFHTRSDDFLYAKNLFLFSYFEILWCLKWWRILVTSRSVRGLEFAWAAFYNSGTELYGQPFSS